MKYIFLRKNLEFLTQSEIEFEIIESKASDEDWCVIEVSFSPDLIFKAFRSGVYCSIHKIDINDFA